MTRRTDLGKPPNGRRFPQSSCQKCSDEGLLIGRLAGFLAWVVRRIDISDGKRSLTVDLNDRFTAGPGVVVHLCRRFGKAAGVQKLPFLGVEFVSIPMLKSPETTVTYSVVGWLWAGIL